MVDPFILQGLTPQTSVGEFCLWVRAIKPMPKKMPAGNTRNKRSSPGTALRGPGHLPLVLATAWRGWLKARWQCWLVWFLLRARKRQAAPGLSVWLVDHHLSSVSSRCLPSYTSASKFPFLLWTTVILGQASLQWPHFNLITSVKILPPNKGRFWDNWG